MKKECFGISELCPSENEIGQVYQENISKIQHFDKQILFLSSVLLVSAQCLQNPVFLYLLVLLSFSIFISQRYQGVLLEVSSCFFLYLVSEENLFLGVLGGLLPSFLLELYVWKKTEIFVPLGVAKLLFIPKESLMFGLLSLVIYSLLDYVLKKNLKLLWLKMNKNRSKSQFFRKLWMNIPYPIVLVSPKFILKKCNHSFIQEFREKTKIEDIFTCKNIEIVQNLIKKSYESFSVSKTLVNEKKKNLLVFARNLEWKMERCVELTIVELSREAYNERIVFDFFSNQSALISELEKGLLMSYKNKNPDSGLLSMFNQICVGFWSYQMFLEHQIDCLSVSDSKKLDFYAELLNTLEVCFRSNKKGLSFQINSSLKPLIIFSHEIQLKVFLFGILDFCIKKSLKNSMISIVLKESEPSQNSSAQSLTIEFFSPDLDAQETKSLLFTKTQKIEEFEKSTKMFSLQYSILPFIMQALGIDFKQITQKDTSVIFEFILSFRLTDSVQQIDKVLPQKLIWQNPDKKRESIKSSLKISNQQVLSLSAKHRIPFEALDYKSSSSKNSSNQNSPKSMPNFLNPRSFSNIAAISTVPCLKRSITGIKNRKSRKNRNKPPDYVVNRKKQIKRFYYKDSLRALNFEIGVFKVLIVDDFEEGRRVIQGLLKEILRISCEFAKDGIGAVEMYEGYASQGFMYQIIFMDLIMPKMTGFEASAKIREKERKNAYPRTYICAVSGDSDCYEKVAKYQIDDVGNCYLAIRPLDIAKIEAIVRRARLVLDNS